MTTSLTVLGDSRLRAIAGADPHAIARHAADIVPKAFHVRFPWASLDTLYGPLLPGSLHIVSARTGAGKTLFVRNWLHALATAAEPCPVAYFPTETPAEEVLRGIVCAELGLNPVAVTRDDWSGLDGGRDRFYETCLEWAKFLFQSGSVLSSPRLDLYDHPRPTVGEVWKTLVEASEKGCRIAIIDHLLRLNLGDGSQMFQEVTAGIRALKMCAQELGLAIVVTSQQSRQPGGDRLAWFAPPDLQALKGAGTIEEEADGVLFLHRCLRDDLDGKTEAGVRKGTIPLQTVIAPNVMGAAIGKHRLDGGRTGAACRLWVEHGRVADLPPDMARAWESAQHAIRTG
jgi:replicative DNA helicase